MGRRGRTQGPNACRPSCLTLQWGPEGRTDGLRGVWGSCEGRPEWDGVPEASRLGCDLQTECSSGQERLLDSPPSLLFRFPD